MKFQMKNSAPYRFYWVNCYTNTVCVATSHTNAAMIKSSVLISARSLAHAIAQANELYDNHALTSIFYGARA